MALHSIATPWTQSLRRVGGAAVAVMAISAVSAAPLVAAPSPPWTAPVQLSNPAKPLAGPASAALNGSGNGTVVWVECAVAGPGPCPGPVDIASITLRGGAFLAQRRVASNQPLIARMILRNGGPPGVRRDAGRFIASWMTPGNRWRESRARLGGLWQLPGPSVPPLGGGASVAWNASGAAVSAYVEGGRLVVDYRRTRAGPFQRVLALNRAVTNPVEINSIPQVAIDRVGRAAVMWAGRLETIAPVNAVRVFVTDLDPPPPGRRRIPRRTRPLSGSVAAANAALGSNVLGDLVVAWNTCSNSSFTGAPGTCTGQVGVQARTRRAGQRRFGPLQTVATGSGGNATAPGATFALRRRPVVTWTDGAAVRAASATRAGGGVGSGLFGGPVSSGPASRVGPIGATLFSNQTGVAALGWLERDPDGIRQVPMAAVLQRNGFFSNPAALDAPGQILTPPLFAVGPRGHALALWTTLTGAFTPTLNVSRARINR